MKRILIFGRSYPHVAHGYINNDVEYIASRASVLVLSPSQPTAPFYSSIDFNYFRNIKELIAQARQFKPDFIVCWLLPNHHYARLVAETLGIPFILKLHTPDFHTLFPARRPIKKRLACHVFNDAKLSHYYLISIRSLRRTAASKQFRGAFCIPALKTAFTKFFPERKIFELTPRIFYSRFHNEETNGERALILGSLVSRREGEFEFNSALSSIKEPLDWYPVPTPGLLLLDIPNIPSNITIKKFVPNIEMAKVYKNYKALIVIGDSKYSRGLPLSILEAQAAGVCVIVPSLRPDFDKFVTDGGGYIFNDESEIQGLLDQIPDQSIREKGFQHAKLFDISGLSKELSRVALEL